MGSVFIPGINETPLRIIFGLGFVLFLPGYALIAALFPEKGSSETEADDEQTQTATSDETKAKPSPKPGTDAAESEPTQPTPSGEHTQQQGIDGIERVALSFGLSIAIVPLIGLGLNFTPWGIRLAPIALSVTVFTLACVAVAAKRRHELPAEERFRVPYTKWIAAGKAELFDPESRMDAALNVVLVISVLLAVGSVGYAVAVPSQGEQFSEFYLLSESEDGELVADGYPDELAVGEQSELIVGIGNNEYETTAYTVVVQLQTVEQTGNTTTVRDREEIDRFQATVEHNGTHHEPHTLRPGQPGENIRVKYLLYKGSAPETPTEENSYRDLHIWIDVGGSSQ
ncbi:hypothetical protein C464_02615 [Halorubrum coriense DSM 10284]|uniref:DUF1616 domain-containing protein n=1 Tax=Halorubrum coriense DSM 10284 TaxID=1227466 RepID=M0EU90_9EURY|nr:hypothetical protein C464_02615 [Halorubrum coriense DSM 10284]